MASLPPIINDSTGNDFLFPKGRRTGLDLSLRSPGPDGYAYAGVAEPFPAELLIPPSEYQARIAERKERRMTIRAKCDAAGLPHKDQGRTNYCWINAPVYCTEVVRVLQNQVMTILSPASAGAQIKRFRNVGGWGKEGLEWIVEHGIVPIDRWPANAIDRKYLTEENRQVALDYRVVEWWELKPNSLPELFSCLLRGMPVAVGYNWWGHEVSAVDVDWVDGEPVPVIRNSWKDWGDNGYAILQGGRRDPDDAVSPRTAIPY